MALLCPRCTGAMHHSRPRSWVERARRRLTGLVPYRCHTCNWREWRNDAVPGLDGPREIHRALTEAELERLEPDAVRGERL